MNARLDRLFRAALLAPFVVAMIVHGSTKPPGVPSATIRWDEGLADFGSVATNDTVFIRGTYDPLMANDALMIDYRAKASTNALDWVNAYNGIVSSLAAGITLTIPGATNMVIYVWSEYVAPSPVHTNGEYRVTYVGSVTNAPPATPRYVATRTRVKTAEGVRLSPPELPEPNRATLMSTTTTEEEQ